MGVTEHWNWAPSLESSKSRLDTVLGALLRVVLLGLERWAQRSLPNSPILGSRKGAWSQHWWKLNTRSHKSFWKLCSLGFGR